MSRKHRSPAASSKPHPFERKGLLYTVYFVLRVLVVLMLVAAVFNRNYENVALCVLTLVLFMLQEIPGLLPPIWGVRPVLLFPEFPLPEPPEFPLPLTVLPPMSARPCSTSPV